MIKPCWSRQIEVIAHAITKELSNDEPNLSNVAVLAQDIIDHAMVIQNQLKNEGVVLDR
jgi:hypothetical protein